MFEQESAVERKITFFTSNLNVAVVASLAVLLLILLLEFKSTGEIKPTAFDDLNHTIVIILLLLGYPTGAFCYGLAESHLLLNVFRRG